jgi:hypothetical protein
MLARVALGRQIKERQGWVDQAEPRRFLVSFDVESDSYDAAARECLQPEAVCGRGRGRGPAPGSAKASQSPPSGLSGWVVTRPGQPAAA